MLYFSDNGICFGSCFIEQKKNNFKDKNGGTPYVEK